MRDASYPSEPVAFDPELPPDHPLSPGGHDISVLLASVFRWSPHTALSFMALSSSRDIPIPVATSTSMMAQQDAAVELAQDILVADVGAPPASSTDTSIIIPPDVSQIPPTSLLSPDDWSRISSVIQSQIDDPPVSCSLPAQRTVEEIVDNIHEGTEMLSTTSEAPSVDSEWYPPYEFSSPTR